MTKQTAKFENYVLPRLRQIVPVDNLVYDELGQLVLAKFNERFKGVRNIEDTTEYKKGQPISFSNVPRALGINQILRQETNGNIRVLSPYEVVQYWDAIPELKETYADTDSIVVYPNEGPNEDLRKRVLDIIGKDSKKVNVPLIVSGLGVEKANNDYGFTFTETEYIKIKDAPFLQRDGKVIYDASEGLVSSKDGIDVLVAQSGLRWLYRYRSGRLDARGADLLNSYEAGRVQIVQGPYHIKNLESIAK